MLSREWRCSWSSAVRRCSNYICVIDNFIAYQGASYIRGFTVIVRSAGGRGRSVLGITKRSEISLASRQITTKPSACCKRYVIIRTPNFTGSRLLSSDKMSYRALKYPLLKGFVISEMETNSVMLSVIWRTMCQMIGKVILFNAQYCAQRC